ncbi:MAG: hypothetical protein HAW67_01845 [Endozoicomonadaceae bacterium]|nr:hypothetical protein [Endozoicomonadaceae bacterium]
MDTKPVGRPKCLRDESHAKAIVFNWMSHAQRETRTNLDNLGEKTTEPPKGKKYNFNKIITPILNAGDSIIVLRSDKHRKNILRSSVDSVVNIAYFELRAHITHPDMVQDFQYTPLMFNVFDTKTLRQQKIMMCLLSDHFLARLLMRTNAENLKALFESLNTLCRALMTAISAETIPKRDFIIVTENEMIPMEYFEIENSPTLRTKTYIPRSDWIGSTKSVCEDLIAKFCPTLDCYFIHSDEFEKRKLAK